ncbi:MAG: FAD-dependent oxidoreductase, partial [Candidatus Eremiobacteraeota bacterium]|nr:FAD-dependent oxidoreductase [Candidatus Eremiobacteraeota bacterium]
MIAGGGFAGSAVARRLEKRLRPDEAEIVLLSRENFTLFTPMLPEVTAGALEVRHIVTPVRAELRHTKFILADVTEISSDRSRVTFRHVLTGLSESIDYDHL